MICFFSGSVFAMKKTSALSGTGTDERLSGRAQASGKSFRVVLPAATKRQLTDTDGFPLTVAALRRLAQFVETGLIGT